VVPPLRICTLAPSQVLTAAFLSSVERSAPKRQRPAPSRA
jgi:hypothetical protein